MSDPIPYYMFYSGAIPGVPGPNGDGTWPAGMTVYIDPDTNAVVSTSLFGGQSIPEGSPDQAPVGGYEPQPEGDNQGSEQGQ